MNQHSIRKRSLWNFFLITLAVSMPYFFPNQLHSGLFPQNVGETLRIDLTLAVGPYGGDAIVTPFVVPPDGDIQLQTPPSTVTLTPGTVEQFSFVFYNPLAGVYTIGAIIQDDGSTPTFVSIDTSDSATRLADNVNEFVLRPTDPTIYSISTTGNAELVELSATTIYGAFLDALELF